jgi:hypothetical protein
MLKVLIDILESLQSGTLMHDNILVAFDYRLEIKNLVLHTIHPLFLQRRSIIGVFNRCQFFINEMINLAN